MVEQASQVTLANHDGRRSANHVSKAEEGDLADFANVMAVQQAYLYASHDPDQLTSVKLLHQSPNALKNHYASYIPLIINPYESRLIQHALETATPEEIIMFYGEAIPFAPKLTTDAFANHVVQKALEVGDLDLKVYMANEFGSNVLECARDKYANHVIQKCMECVPPQHIEFIFSSFCEKAKEFSIHPYGCHVIQHVVEHEGPGARSMIVNKSSERIYNMRYNIFASNIIKRCLIIGDSMDRKLIFIEILAELA
ncbi:hypothetical protein EJB05_24933, partial [Eragrostis curvula]